MDYNKMRVTELKPLRRGHRLRGYSQLRKAELIAFLQNNPRPPPRSPPAPHTRLVGTHERRPPRPTRATPPPLLVGCSTSTTSTIS